jgi:small GTP-binding protein
MNLQLKLIVLGNQYVGKTSLIKRLTNNNFTEYYLSTIGVDYEKITVDYNEKEHEIILWDTSGQDKFNFLLNSYFNTVNGAIIMYDINDIQSFNQAQKWIDEFRIRKDNDNIPILLVANKIDYKTRYVCTKDLENVAKEYNVKSIEISVKNNINIDSILPIIIDDYLDKLKSNLISLEKDKINILKKNSFQILDKKDPEPKCCNII